MDRERETLLGVAGDEGRGGAFLWGAAFGFVSGAVAVGLSVRRWWQRSREGVREEGRIEERQKLELEITNQRREADLRRREAETRRWEIEDAHAEVQRLRWDLSQLREQSGLSLSEREARIRALEVELAAALRRRER